MKAFITASFDSVCLEKLGAEMAVCHEDYRESGKIYFDDEELVDKLKQEAAEVLIVEADLVHEEVFENYALKIIGFDMDLMQAMGQEMVFMQELAHAGKIAQGLFVAKKA